MEITIDILCGFFYGTDEDTTSWQLTDLNWLENVFYYIIEIHALWV
jgi:hypothetical protein